MINTFPEKLDMILDYHLLKQSKKKEIIKDIIETIQSRIDEIKLTTTRYERGEWINFYKGFDTAIEKVEWRLLKK